MNRYQWSNLILIVYALWNYKHKYLVDICLQILILKCWFDNTGIKTYNSEPLNIENITITRITKSKFHMRMLTTRNVKEFFKSKYLIVSFVSADQNTVSDKKGLLLHIGKI